MQAFSLKSIHDPSNPLIHATHPDLIESFSYDPVGNRLPGIYDGANRLLEDNEFTYTYDANGNLIKKVEKATGRTTTYSYDAENQLISVISEQGSVISYKYDGLGRRIEKNVDGKITRYVYDNEDIILEYDGEGNLIAEYIHGPGIDEPIKMVRDKKIYYYIPDALWSIRALVDTIGYIRQMYEYNAFGGIRVLNEEGKEIDPEEMESRIPIHSLAGSMIQRLGFTTTVPATTTPTSGDSYRRIQSRDSSSSLNLSISILIAATSQLILLTPMVYILGLIPGRGG
jgi:YD repeat-containing protein